MRVGMAGAWGMCACMAFFYLLLPSPACLCLAFSLSCQALPHVGSGTEEEKSDLG